MNLIIASSSDCFIYILFFCLEYLQATDGTSDVETCCETMKKLTHCFSTCFGVALDWHLPFFKGVSKFHYVRLVNLTLSDLLIIFF
jgi:hypothetical protein